jgi:ATP-dependent Clp protease ATP-binding subunit ClpB
MTGIVDVQIERLRKMLEDKKMTLELDNQALIWLADKGYDPVYGARPLKRVIQRELQNPLAGLLLAGKIAEGDSIHISSDGSSLIINGELVAAA